MAAISMIVAVLALVISSTAQVGPQATQLPACIKTCDPPAIASVNCTNADQYCHCVRQNGILTNITACADVTCQNPSASIFTFTTLFGEVCTQFNISVPVIGSNSSANGTNVTYPSSTASMVPYTGAAHRGTYCLATLLSTTLLGVCFLAAL
ncbi:hypothetical protein Tdes44962_MAKER06115 [Teratosphaeria destructans]|uniref:CFEM domain-containing protein n=1 Tax=Teratosphaeria destructans TaxID=418781 RepID=A0A9W7SI15_9PEZI|nr:hypothetical protein Tdes44962_MAKER06115 [Teratosphaeria destructans]